MTSPYHHNVSGVPAVIDGIVTFTLATAVARVGNTSQSLSDDAAYKDFYDSAQFVTGLICYPLVCAFGLIGNILSLVVLAQRKMATSTNVYLIALAIADSIKLVNDSIYFFVILLLKIDESAGKNCIAYIYPYAHYVFNMSVCITAWLTVSVGAERYIMVCHATRARGMCNIQRARMLSLIVFVTMSTLTIPLALRYRTVTHTKRVDNVTTVTIAEIEVTQLWMNKTFVTSYTWIQNLLRSVIPLIVLSTMNAFIIMALRRTRANKKKMTSRHRITLMLLSVVIVFLLCVTPDAVMSTFFGFGYYDADYLVRGVREITDLLLAVNSAVNFVLYCTFNKVFRKNFMVLFFSTCYRGKIQSDDPQLYKSSYSTCRQTMVNGVPKYEQESVLLHNSHALKDMSAAKS